MKNYVVSIGYGENVVAIQYGEGFGTFDTVEAESAEEAAIFVHNGLDPVDTEGAIYQVVEEEDYNEIKWFSFEGEE